MRCVGERSQLILAAQSALSIEQDVEGRARARSTLQTQTPILTRTGSLCLELRPALHRNSIRTAWQTSQIPQSKRVSWSCPSPGSLGVPRNDIVAMRSNNPVQPTMRSGMTRARRAGGLQLSCGLSYPYQSTSEQLSARSRPGSSSHTRRARKTRSSSSRRAPGACLRT